MFLLFNMLSSFVIAFIANTKCLLISWLHSPCPVILEPKKIKSVIVSIVSPSICHKVMGLDARILLFWMLSFKLAFFFPLSASSINSFFFLFSFLFFIFLLYNIVLVFQYINMNLPQVYRCSPSWTLLPPRTIPHIISYMKQVVNKLLVPLYFLPWGLCHLHIWGYWYFSRQSRVYLEFHLAWHFTWYTLHVSSIRRVTVYSFGTLLSQFWTVYCPCLIINVASWSTYRFLRRQLRLFHVSIIKRIFQCFWSI